MRTSKRKENFMHSLGSLDDSCFMAFPMGQDSMWASAVWCSHCIPVRLGGTTHMKPAQPRPPFSSLAKQTAAQRQSHAISACLQIIGQTLERTITPGLTSHCECNPPPTSGCPHLQIVALVSQLGLNLEEPHDCCAVDKLLTSLRSQKKKEKEESERPEGMRCLLMPMPQADALGFSFLRIQHIRRDASQQSWHWNKAELLSKKHCNLSQWNTRNNQILKGVARHRASYPLSLFI